MSRYISWIDQETRVFILLLAVVLAAFFWGVGLNAHSLPYPPDSEYSDAVTSHWPNALYLRHSILDDHTFPLWRPLLMNGQPFAANPLNKVWYPPQWLVLLFPPIIHLNFMLWLHLWIGGIGAWVWSRATGLKPWPAALVGLGYAFAPRLIASAGAGHLDLIYASAWLPWLLWAVYRAVRPVPARYASLVLGGFAALCFLADVRLCVYALITAAAYAGWQWWQLQPTARQVGPTLLASFLFAAGLSAVQWIPLLLYRADLSRNTMSIKDASVFSLDAGKWIGLVFGEHGGAWETMVYVGVSTLVLALATILLRPRQLRFWAFWLLLIALYAMGDHFILWSLLVRVLPPLRWWRVPPRSWLIAALILPYLAGWGAQTLSEYTSERRVVRLSIFALLGAGLTCSLFSTLTLSPPLKQTSVLGLFALPAVALVILLAILGKLKSEMLVILFTLIVGADVLWIDRTLIDSRTQDQWLEPNRALAEFLRDDGAIRVYSPTYSFPQQAAAYWNIDQFGGVDPFQFSSTVKAVEAATGVHSEGYSVTLPAFKTEGDNFDTANQDAVIVPDLLGQWLVTHVVSAYEIKIDGLSLATRIGDVYVYRNTRVPEVNLTWDGPNRVTVRTDETLEGPVYAVAAGRWSDHDEKPGLSGTVDGRQYTYSASEIWLSLSAGGILIALAGFMGWRTRHENHPG